MQVGFYPGWNDGFVRTYFRDLHSDGQRKKAEAKLQLDIFTLESHWPSVLNVTVRSLKGYEPLWELKREYQNIKYRIFFCVNEDQMWLLHAIEKKEWKTPSNDLDLAYKRMVDVFSGKVRM
jgi:phage-related protein